MNNRFGFTISPHPMDYENVLKFLQDDKERDIYRLIVAETGKQTGHKHFHGIVRGYSRTDSFRKSILPRLKKVLTTNLYAETGFKKLLVIREQNKNRPLQACVDYCFENVPPYGARDSTVILNRDDFQMNPLSKYALHTDDGWVAIPDKLTFPFFAFKFVEQKMTEKDKIKMEKVYQCIHVLFDELESNKICCMQLRRAYSELSKAINNLNQNIRFIRQGRNMNCDQQCM